MAVKLALKTKIHVFTSWFRRYFHLSDRIAAENDGFIGQASKVKPSRRKALLIGVCEVHTNSEFHNDGTKAENTFSRSENFSVPRRSSEELFSELPEEDNDEGNREDPPKLNRPHTDVEAMKKLLIGGQNFPPLLIIMIINPIHFQRSTNITRMILRS